MKPAPDLDYRHRFSAEVISQLSNASLYEEMGMEKSNFARLIKSDPWNTHIKKLGLAPLSVYR